MQNIDDLKKACLGRLERMDKLIEQYEEVAYQELKFDDEHAKPSRSDGTYFTRMEEFNTLMKQFIEHADFIRRIEALGMKDKGLEDNKDELYHMLKNLPSEKVDMLLEVLSSAARPSN